LADAYATAFMAMGLENAKNTLLELDIIEAYLTYNDVNNTSQVFITDGFKGRLLQ
jgi:thiamine biosynthesis lipoprotein